MKFSKGKIAPRQIPAMPGRKARIVTKEKLHDIILATAETFSAAPADKRYLIAKADVSSGTDANKVRCVIISNVVSGCVEYLRNYFFKRC